MQRFTPPVDSPSEPAASSDEEYLLTPAEARLATTLALMTGFGHGCCAAHRVPLAARVAEQLEQLASEPQLSDGMRALLRGLLRRWQAASEPATARPGASDFLSPSVLWHAPSETLQ